MMIMMMMMMVVVVYSARGMKTRKKVDHVWSVGQTLAVSSTGSLASSVLLL